MACNGIEINVVENCEPVVDSLIPDRQCFFAVIAESIHRRIGVADLIDLFRILRVITVHELSRDLNNAIFSRVFRLIGRWL
jgi:hypothetical protein